MARPDPVRFCVILAVVCCAAGVGCIDDKEVLGPGPVGASTAPAGTRAPDLHFRFDEGAGTRVLDSSGSGFLTHLQIQDPMATQWQPDGLNFVSSGIVTGAPPRAFVQACRRSGQFTVETWITPEGPIVEGTRRIVTLSANSTARNFTLGIGGLFSAGPQSVFTFRARFGPGNRRNGLPALSTPPDLVQPKLTHLLALVDDRGQRLFVDGVEVAKSNQSGNLEDWDPVFPLALGQEIGEDDARRAFAGKIHMVALYATALSDDEIKAHFAAGSGW